MKKGSVELGADEKEGESESKIMNQIFGRLQHPKNEVRYLENIFSDFRSVFPHQGVFVAKVIKANIMAIKEVKILGPIFSVTNTSLKIVSR